MQPGDKVCAVTFSGNELMPHTLCYGEVLNVEGSSIDVGNWVQTNVVMACTKQPYFHVIPRWDVLDCRMVHVTFTYNEDELRYCGTSEYGTQYAYKYSPDQHKWLT